MPSPLIFLIYKAISQYILTLLSKLCYCNKQYCSLQKIFMVIFKIKKLEYCFVYQSLVSKIVF